MLRAGHSTRWEDDELVIRVGERADSAIILRSGLLKVHRNGPDGGEVLLELAGPGDLLGEISAVRDALRGASATALGPVDAVVIGVRSLRAFLTQHPDATLALLDLALSRLRIVNARLLEFATSESLARVTSRVLELAERFGVSRDEQIDVELPITQDELAQWSGSSLESTARALRTLRGLALIETHRRRLVVLDLDGLRSHAARL